MTMEVMFELIEGLALVKNPHHQTQSMRRYLLDLFLLNQEELVLEVPSKKLGIIVSERALVPVFLKELEFLTESSLV